MAAPTPVAWRRRFPARPLRRLAWYVVGGGSAVATGWLLFGAEPDRLASGELNPLALVPAGIALLLGLAVLPLVLTVFRRPLLRADHYALRIRPGSLRTLLLPWAAVAELTVITVRGEPTLLVRREHARGPVGDQTRWLDRGVLRAAGTRAAGYDLAVRLDEFTGTVEAQLASLAARAPRQVRIVDDR